MRHPYYDLLRADTTLRPCGLCAASMCGRCTGGAFNSTSEPCPCAESGHGEGDAA